MSRSIGGQLFIGLAVAGIASSFVLTLIVAIQYGFFGNYPPSAAATFYEISYHVLLPVVVFVSLFGFGAAVTVHRVSKRLQHAAAEADAAARDGRAFRAPIEQLPRETKPLAEAVNRLTARLEANADRQGAFAADAAHELKTPLAILALELDRLPASDASRLKHQIHALSEMVDQLLLLARAESPDPAEYRQGIDLGAVGRQIASELAPTAIQQGKSIAFEDREPVPVNGLEAAISTATRSLAVNALRVSDEGTEVVIAAGPGPCVSVFDGGEGLTADDLEQLKGRGIRCDRRSSGYAGLGLAIADRITQAHGGRLETCMPEHPGLRLRLSN